MFLSQKKRSTPLSFINVDISQRLQAISLPFTDCACMIECESIMADKGLIYMVKSIGPRTEP